ncbi:MAG TPA: hypothetical protein VJR23_13390 [Candidatus Acidoferrales bacterium]|nr:hypothetical protein [Candidatus Acidoferrales bacterium]
MPCPKDVRRADKTGRARKGSQRQIQSCINLDCEKFTQAVGDALGFPASARHAIEWVSPLQAEQYNEYQDREFLEVLGLERFAKQLAEFWPGRGPCWDALAKTGDGCILVEAKSHVSEIYGGGCHAKGNSLKRIKAALDETKKHLGVRADAVWTGKLYQSANRYAYLYFLREKCSVPAFLLNVYFEADPASPTSREEWTAAIIEVNSLLGLSSPVPFRASLFYDASSLP